MNQELWAKISAFDFDYPASEYGFSTRLAHENYWTQNFTQLAIAEYKKFMYLAATSDVMVSPSPIIDAVWHQHLIFTQSYKEFCDLLGKQIQHVPSTHNKAEFQKFRNAKENTTRLYKETFGVQPKVIWAFGNMFESLFLEKARFKIRSFLIVGILTVICLTIPFYFLLKPVYSNINNPYFLYALFSLAIVVFVGLETYNRSRLRKMVDLFDKDSFIFDLHPYEVIYLKTGKLYPVINGTVNELIEKGIIAVHPDNTIELVKPNATATREQLQATSLLSEWGKTFYPPVLKALLGKPIFRNTENCMNAFRKYFNKSKKFGNLFYLNFIVLTILLLLSFTRVMTGAVREKPIVQIVFITIVLAIGISVFLARLTVQVCKATIPNIYQSELLPGTHAENDWRWNYFLAGTAVLAPAFVPLATYVDRHNNTNSGGSSCGTSCGSSCGSSCGGCGGGD